MHEQIEEQDIIERYVRDQLSTQEREAFEEHYFSCDQCFEKVRLTERFVAGVRDAGGRGLLAEEAGESTRASWRRAWWPLAFGLSAAAAVVLAVAASWMYFVQIPRIRGQLDESRAALRSGEQARAAVGAEQPPELQAEVNVPLVILQSERGGGSASAEAVLPASASRLIVWIDGVPTSYAGYRLEVYGPKNELVEALGQLVRNKYGALAASLPVQRLQSGEFRIKLLGEKNGSGSLLAEFTLKISKQ